MANKKEKEKDKNYRKDDLVGPDYVCSSCGVAGYRLWRDSHVMLDAVTLSCAMCAEVAEAANIERYKEHHHGDLSCTIGNLVPARPTPEGDTFWGHTSGDAVWWYTLPQYKDREREFKLVVLERNSFKRQLDYYTGEYLKASQDKYQAVRDRDEAMRFAKLSELPE